MYTKFGNFTLKNEFRNAKIDQLIERSIMRVFNERTSIVELVRDLRAMNVLAIFENDPRKIMDVRALTGIFNVGSWKMRKKAQKSFGHHDKIRDLC